MDSQNRLESGGEPQPRRKSPAILMIVIFRSRSDCRSCRALCRLQTDFLHRAGRNHFGRYSHSVALVAQIETDRRLCGRLSDDVVKRWNCQLADSASFCNIVVFNRLRSRSSGLAIRIPLRSATMKKGIPSTRYFSCTAFICSSVSR